MSRRYREQQLMKSCPYNINEWTSELQDEREIEYSAPELPPLSG
jgi:hypothetical protein